MNQNIRRHSHPLGLVLLLLVATLVLAACGANKGLRSGSETPVAQNPGDEGHGVQGQNIDVRGLEGVPEDDRAMFTDPANPLSTRIIYFGFDSSAIPSRFASVIRAHARYLAKHPRVHLRLEGHTDPRGTREYNVALGERRAESVEQALVLSGADSKQITTLSFGEERPAVAGTTSQAYAKDRRVKLIYVE